MDSTHGICVDDTQTANGRKKKCYLYTLVARCAATGKGAPLAWMITNSESQYPVQFRLKWLNEDHGFSPQRFMIDNSDAEIFGIRLVYGDCQCIFLCHWHILKNWVKNIGKVKVQIGCRVLAAAVEARREVGLTKLKRMLYATSEDEYDLGCQDLKQWCVMDEDQMTEEDRQWDAVDLWVYFERTYAEKKKLWSNAWRQVRSVWIYWGRGITRGKAKCVV
jgi:hypothetical protein